MRDDIGEFFDVPHVMLTQNERENVVAAYYAGIAAAMDVLRAYDFPFTERVDHIAEELTPGAR